MRAARSATRARKGRPHPLLAAQVRGERGWEGAGVCNVRLLAPIACSGCIINSASACRLPADYYQPYLGGASCKVCSPTADPRYTSNAGDDYCLVEWVDTTCGNGEDNTRAEIQSGVAVLRAS